MQPNRRGFRPSELKKQKEQVKPTPKPAATDAEHEHRQGVRRLVQSKEYQILKIEAARLGAYHMSKVPGGLPTDTTSEIAYDSACKLQSALSLLFIRLEEIARENQ